MIPVLAFLLLASDASAHARLVRSDPADAATVATAPAAVDLWFDAEIEQRFHELVLRGPDGAETKLQGVVDAKHVHAPLPTLSSGRWEVRWDVVSRDGHRVAGVVGFVVE
jgi:copper resistance protein C